MLAMRKKHKDVLVYGNFEVVHPDDEKIIAYTRSSVAGDTILVLCNFSPDTVEWKGEMGKVEEVAVSNYNRTREDFREPKVTLGAYEACALFLI